jgi:cytidine deaminase
LQEEGFFSRAIQVVMKKKQHVCSYELYESGAALSTQDASLLREAQKAAEQAYAPYSRFKVGASALLSDGSLVTGSNQENASFPAGLCAERVLLSAISAFYPDLSITAMAISYIRPSGPADCPISPCGICRQSLQEYEQRMRKPIRLILGGQQGQVIVLAEVGMLLPLAFTSKELL